MQTLLHRTPDYLDLKRNCRSKGIQQSWRRACSRGQKLVRTRLLPQWRSNQTNGRGGLRNGSQCSSLNVTSAACRRRRRRACLRSEVWNSGTVTKLAAAQFKLQPKVSTSARSLQSWHSDMPKCPIAIMPSSGIEAAVTDAGIIKPTVNTVKATRKKARRWFFMSIELTACRRKIHGKMIALP